MMEIIPKDRNTSLATYSKQEQANRNFRTYRDPEKLRELLRLKMPDTLEASQSERYGRCAHPKCAAYGTIDHPLDLHHVIPRSQSVARQHDFQNHLYLCGDFFFKNHHKALHGEDTPGREDWKSLGIFDDIQDEEPCSAEKIPVGMILKILMDRDHMARVLYRKDPALLVDYARRKNLVPENNDPQLLLLHEWMA